MMSWYRREGTSTSPPPSGLPAATSLVALIVGRRVSQSRADAQSAQARVTPWALTVSS